MKKICGHEEWKKAIMDYCFFHNVYFDERAHHHLLQPNRVLSNENNRLQEKSRTTTIIRRQYRFMLFHIFVLAVLQMQSYI